MIRKPNVGLNFRLSWKEKYKSLILNHLIKSYPNFWWKSTNQHGVHSPFVYQLVTLCFYDHKEYSSYPILKNFRKEILHNQQAIEVKDLGAGSQVFHQNKRKVASIAKNAGTTLKRSKFLNRLTRYFQIKTAVELGTSVGIGAASIACKNPVDLFTIEGCPQTAAIAKSYFKKYNFNHIQLQVGDFKDQIPHIPFQKIDLAFIDGHHSKEATLCYFEALLPFIHNDTLFIFDDIYWSSGMQEAWEEIKKHPQVKVTIDTFFWGMVFFRKEQEKEHFKIRL